MLRAFTLVLALAATTLAQSQAPADSASSSRDSQRSASPASPSPRSSVGRSTQPTPKLLSAATSSATSPSPREDSTAESTLLTLANQSREQVGAPPLRVNPNLAEAARAHARRMVEQQQLSHQFEGEPSLMPRLIEVGLQVDRAGENIAYNSSAEHAFLSLMQSPPHRQNLLDPRFDSAGFAAFRSDGRLYVVQDFAHVLPRVVATSVK
jgi:uncharacterized protein YkwD